ncbi:MAG: epoxyqueuosine reductase [Euryarchaeota archaeon]|nr:epoxyqueuosine reductase [Euryarchaeota archaeon]
MLAERIEQRAKEAGAEIVEFTELRLSRRGLEWVRSAVVLGLSAQNPLVTAGIRYPSWKKPRIVVDVLLGEIAREVAEFMRSLGYRCEVLEQRHGLDLRLIAQRAGAGVVGRSGLLLTEKFGPRVRMTALLSDAALRSRRAPPESPCRGCRRCVNACPRGVLENGFSAAGCASAVISEGWLVMRCSACVDVCPAGGGSERR